MSQIWAFIYPPSFIWIIFVANSVATVDKGDVGNTPLKYFDNKAVFPTHESPIIIILYKWSYFVSICKP